MATPQETHDKAKGIIQNGLDTHFQGKVRFHEVRITPRSGGDDEEYLDVQVIYVGKPSDLNPGLLNSLYGVIESDLRAIGVEKIPSISYREKTEDGEWSELVQAVPPEAQFRLVPEIEPADHQRFLELADQWKSETVLLSSTDQVTKHPAHQEIISVGEPVVPLILERMQSQGGHWFHALREITGADPVSPDDRGNGPAMQEAWLDWGELNGLA